MTLWLNIYAGGGWAPLRRQVDFDPFPTLTTASFTGGGRPCLYWLEDDGKPPMTTATDKPPYRIPPMAEIAAVPWNGLNAVGFFSGCGGSALGCRMAGYKVLYACDTDPKARASYLANWPDARIDSRGVRAVRPEDVFAVTGLGKGEIDLVEASPPCTSFSTAGKRHKGWGKVREHAGTVQRVDDLFFAFADVLEGLQPRAFFAENVSGLIKGTAKGYFLEILARLKGAGYRVEARLLDAQWLGVPQTRQRLIFVGVRHDLGRAPAFPKPLPYRYSVRDACPWIGGFGGDPYGFQAGKVMSADSPFPAVSAHGAAGGVAPRVEVQDGYANGIYSPEGPARAVRAGRAVSIIPLAPSRLAGRGRLTEVAPDGPAPTLTYRSQGNDCCPPGPARRKFTIAEVKRLCAFTDDFKLTGSYSDQWARLGNAVPPVMAFHIARMIRDKILFKAAGKGPWPHDPACLVPGVKNDGS